MDADFLPGDRARLEAFRAGRRDVLTEAYRHYRPHVELLMIRGFTLGGADGPRRFMGFDDPMRVDDAVQEVFERAFGKRARLAYDGLRPYLPYLLQLARNLVVDRLRAEKRGMERYTVRGEATSAAAESEASPAWEEREIVAVARGFLDELEPDMRRLLELRYVEDRPQREVAVALGVSIPTLRRRERELFEAFFRHMRERGYLEHHAPNLDARARRAAGAKLVLAALSAALEMP